MSCTENPGMKQFWRVGNGECDGFAYYGKTVIEIRGCEGGLVLFSGFSGVDGVDTVPA